MDNQDNVFEKWKDFSSDKILETPEGKQISLIARKIDDGIKKGDSIISILDGLRLTEESKNLLNSIRGKIKSLSTTESWLEGTKTCNIKNAILDIPVFWFNKDINLNTKSIPKGSITRFEL